MKPRYQMLAGTAPGTAEILLYGEISEWGVSALQFAQDLKALGEVSRLKVRINSIGGSVSEGLAIYSTLKNHPATVTVVVVDGIAASMASVIAMAGDVVVMQAGALMMIHNPACDLGGYAGADELRKGAEYLDKITQAGIAAYKAKTGLPDDAIAAMMTAETWMTAAEAVETGFADVVGEEMDATACADLSRFPKAPKMQARHQPPAAAAGTKTAAMEAGALVEVCSAKGFPQLAAALLRAGATAEAVTARLEAAADIAQCCDLTRAPAAMKDAMLSGGITLEAARIVIAEHRAALDEAIVTDTAIPGTGMRGQTARIDHNAVYARLNQRGAGHAA